MSIRVISGTAKGRKLKMVQGESTRPIMDRVKEALFNILGTGIQGCSFLDLFAGTGSVGIEALSRGAERVLMIDLDRFAIRTINENLDHTGLAERAEVLRTDAFAYLQRPNPEAFEYIFIAPPQYEGLWKKTLLALDENPAHIQLDGIVVEQVNGVEIGNSGVYYHEFQNLKVNKDYIVIAEQMGSFGWKDYKIILKKNN